MKRLFMILPLALILCFMVGCQDKAAMAELEEFKAQAKVEEENKAHIKHFIDEMNKGNVEVWKELYTPDFALYSPSGVTEPISLEETIEVFKMNLKGFPDLNWVIHEIVAKGDKVIGRFTLTGTHSGDWQGIPASGNKIKFTEIAIFHIKDGKVVELREEADMLGFYQQLGMELKPKEGE